MSSLNKVLLMGNLTRDPEVRTTNAGTAVGELGIAVNRKVKDGENGWKDETTFVDVTIWGSTATNCEKYLLKGRPVLIEGRLQLDSWEDKETGVKRTKLKVVAESVQFLNGGGNGNSESSQRARETKQQRLDREAAGGPNPDRADGEPGLPDNYPSTPDDDDIPF